jgi:hypothetical protein
MRITAEIEAPRVRTNKDAGETRTGVYPLPGAFLLDEAADNVARLAGRSSATHVVGLDGGMSPRPGPDLLAGISGIPATVPSPDASGSRIRGLETAAEIVVSTKAQTLRQDPLAILAQAGPQTLASQPK